MVAERAVWLDPLPLGCSVPEHGVRLQELLCWGRGSVMDKTQNPKHGPNPQWSASATQAPPRGSFPTLSDSGSIGGSGYFESQMPCTHLSAHHIKTHHVCVVGTSETWVFILFCLLLSTNYYMLSLFIKRTVKWFGRPELSQKDSCLSVYSCQSLSVAPPPLLDALSSLLASFSLYAFLFSLCRSFSLLNVPSFSLGFLLHQILAFVSPFVLCVLFTVD